MTARLIPVTDNSAPEGTRPLLHALSQKFGRVPNLFATIGQSPAALGGLLGFMDVLGHGALSAREIELINLHVSELNGCSYCVSAHSAIGKLGGMDPDSIERGRLGQGANERENAILALARRVSRTGGLGAGTELATARESGVSDAAVIEVLAHTALKLFTNSVALVAQTENDFPKGTRLPSI